MRIQLVTEMIKKTEENWTRFLRTQERWMANTGISEDTDIPDYSKIKQLGLQMLIQPVFIAQQYRSQALAANDKQELVPSNYADARKEAVMGLIEQLNMSTRTPKQFLDMLGDKLIEI